MITTARCLHRRIPVLLIFLLVPAGCSEEPHGDPIVNFEEDDAEMNAAIDKARRTLGEFLTHLEANPGDEMSLIKAPIDTGESIEHIWIDRVHFDGTQFTGRLANEPFDLSKYKMGDEVTVPKEMISDWIYVENDQMHGGYTMEVMQRRMAE